MPHVFLFGRELSFSSDELAPIAVLGIVIRLVWVAISVPFGLGALDANEQCTVNNSTAIESPLFNATLFHGLLAGQSALQLLAFVILLIATTRGTIIQPSKRRAVAYIVGIMFLFEFLLFGTIGFGIYSFVTLPGNDGVELCDAFVLATGSVAKERIREELIEDLHMVTCYTLIGIIFSLLNNLGFVLMFWMALNRNRARRSDDFFSGYERNVTSWESRCRCLCGFLSILACKVFGSITGDSPDEGYRAMAELFTSYFKDSGLSALDVVAAFLLIRAEQKAEQHLVVAGKDNTSPFSEQLQPYNDLLASSRSPKRVMKAQSFSGPAGSVKTIKGIPQRPIDMLEGSDHEDDNSEEFATFLSDAMAYAPYMLAVYGWKVLVYMHRSSPLRGIRKLIVHRNKLRTGKITGDNCFGCYQGAIASHIGDDSIDVVHASFVGVAGEQVPYVVAVDHKKKKVVLVIRGTLSLNDCFTDALIEPKELKEMGETWGFEGAGHYAHRGFLEVAMTIRQDLERTGVLHKLLGATKTRGARTSKPVDGMTTEGVVKVDSSALPSVSSYQLVIVGHSMGAAIAGIVGVLLRPAFPTLLCMGYSTPATVFSFELAEQCSAWMRTVWVGKDVVARSSYRALEEVRERIYDVLIRCKVNKFTVLRSMLVDMPLDRLLYTPDQAPDTSVSRAMNQARDVLKQRSAQSVYAQHPLYNAGKLLHLVKVETESTAHCTGLNCFKRADRRFVPTWVHNRAIVKDFQISSRMLFDHFPDVVAATIESVAEEYCYFSPTSDKLLMQMTSSPAIAVKKNVVQTGNPQFESFDVNEELKIIANSL